MEDKQKTEAYEALYNTGSSECGLYFDPTHISMYGACKSAMIYEFSIFKSISIRLDMPLNFISVIHGCI